MAEFAEHSILNATTLCGHGVGNSMECDHGVFWDEDAGVLRFQRKLYFFAEEESRIGNTVSHLDKVLDGEISDGVSIVLADAVELFEDRGPVSMLIEQSQEDGAVFEGAVQALAEEGYDRVRRIAKQQGLSIHMPRRAFDSHHRTSRVAEVVL